MILNPVEVPTVYGRRTKSFPIALECSSLHLYMGQVENYRTGNEWNSENKCKIF